MDSLTSNDLQIFREKSRTFCGSVKVPLDKICYEELPNKLRQLNKKNVTKLIDSFRSEDCLRLDPEHHVPALIPRSAVPQGLRPGGEPPHFDPEHPVICLHGRHRLEAARKFLTGNEHRWWVVDLYSRDLNSQVKDVLREHDAKSTKRYDGDIVRQIRISTLRGDTARRGKWLARLSKSMQRCLLRLEALPEAFTESWDALIPFTGLWPALLPGTFDRLLNLRCPEEMTRYLRRIRKTWTRILGDEEADQLQLDANTVAILQGRCPLLSLEDRAHVQSRFLAGDVLPAVKADNERSWVFNRACSIEYVIPSIYTFLEDTKYLEPAARILKKLLPGKCKDSISQHFRALHSGQTKVKVQTSEFTYEDRTSSSDGSLWLSYRQLWLFALRHFPSMDGQLPRRDLAQQSILHAGRQQRRWYELCSLASENGYRRMRCLYRDRKAADAEAIENCVRNILPSKYYAIDSERMRQIVQVNCQLLGDMPYVERRAVAPELTADHEGCGPNISDRCGRPRERSFQTDEENLFLKHIYSTSYSTRPKRHLTSFAVKRDSFRAFFGSEDDLDQHQQLGSLQESPAEHQEKEDVGIADSGVQPANNYRSPSLPDAGEDVVPEQGHNGGLNAEDPVGPIPSRQRSTPSPTVSVSPVGGTQTSLVPYVPPSGASQPRSPMYVFGQQGEEQAITLAQASRVVFSKRSVKERTFAVLSPTGNGRFRKRHADSRNKLSMTTALQLPSVSHFVARDKGKRLKLMAPTTILEEAHSERLQAVVTVSQHNVQELIRRFENYEDPEEEL